MADTEKQEAEEEIIITETPPEEAKADDPKPEDERLSAASEEADDEDDGDDEDGEKIVVKSHKRRRERQKRGREQSRQEIEALRMQVAQMAQLVTSLQGNQLQAAEQTLDSRISQAQADAREAEAIMAQAINDGDGVKVSEALRIRDAAREEATKLALQKQQLAQARQQPQQQGPDPRVQRYASQWLDDNADWYDPNGADNTSVRVKQLDAQVAREGYNPATPAYWQELTRRCEAEFGTEEPATPRRKAPPTGTTREHAPASTRREVYVSPERKAAMIQAGVWDDPKARADMLKYYQQYDHEQPSA